MTALLKVGVIQMNSTNDEAKNFPVIEKLVRDAAANGAKFICLPETAYYRGRFVEAPRDTLPGRATSFITGLAKELGVWIHGGSFAPVAPGNDSIRANTAFIADPSGAIAGTYDKIHLFDVDLPNLKVTESENTRPGSKLVVTDVAGWPVGQLVCYDLRFAEVWIGLRKKGAAVITCPANFTAKTGEAHWEPLLRARAIETQCYVLAAAEWGRHPVLDIESFGNAMIVDPWGEVLARAPREGDTVIYAELLPARLESIRTTMPVFSHRRPSAYT